MILLANSRIYCASIKSIFAEMKREKIKKRKVTKYSCHEEISNVLIKNTLVVCEFTIYVRLLLSKESV